VELVSALKSRSLDQVEAVSSRHIQRMIKEISQQDAEEKDSYKYKNAV
jgi:hypothetical protein